jgi:hypothetical protein
MEDRDYIEEFILENRENFDTEEPPEGHFERFQSRLKEDSKGKRLNWHSIWRIAAITVFVFLAVNQARIWITPKTLQPVTLSSISPEYAEVEFYYTNAINTGINNLNSLTRAGVMTEEENEMIRQEFREYEKRYASIQEDLKANPNDERVINAMIGYYQSKLNIIEMILSKLQEVKQLKNKSHEAEI